ncbi:class IIb bacteriocin, lactobin A/cerein 7B family [Streptococcus suis]|nr:class IIb bacteriocin, lactobin A/cerein 7B family [Streptococcus suis]
MDNMNANFVALTDRELMDMEGGFVITGTMVGIGVGIFTGAFAVGYAIGQSTKK